MIVNIYYYTKVIIIIQRRVNNMIRIHFDNKDFVDIQTTMKDYVDCTNKIENVKYNWLVFNNKTIVNFDKIVYVEQIGDKDNE